MAAESNNLIAPNEEKPSTEDRRKDLKQFEGTKSVVKKEDGFVWNWIKTMFFSGKTLKEIIIDVAENSFVPWLKDGAYNMGTSFLSQWIYRDHKSAPGPGTVSQNSSFITNYVSYGDKKKQQEKTLQDSKKQDEEEVKQGFEHPAFENDPPGTVGGKTAFQKAREFLAEMHRYVNKYGTLSVEDLGWMRGKTVNYVWENYGWTKEEILAIKEPTHINNPKTPYIIMMPKAHDDYDKV